MASVSEEIRRYEEAPQEMKAALDVANAYDELRHAEATYDSYVSVPSSRIDPVTEEMFREAIDTAWVKLDDAYERWSLLR